MAHVQILNEIVANQIAAGEVIERPSSVVKELVENALDAHAHQIDVFIEEGGVKRMSVIDNGTGMDSSDAALCFSRYATSKISSADDISHVTTFGFRGEALASIASVARVQLRTRCANDPAATEVNVEGGKITGTGLSALSQGTRLDIKDLFFNMPARRKFLKTERIESSAIERVVRTLALSQPDVGFRLVADDKPILDVKSASGTSGLSDPRQIERVITCLGEDVREHLFPFQDEKDGVGLSGYLVSPLMTRKDLRGIYLFVNGRPIDERELKQIVKVGFRSLLEVGRFPICVLDIKVDPSCVDVNVHPQKAEVRFSDARHVHGCMIRMLQDFLATTPWIKSLTGSAQTRYSTLPQLPPMPAYTPERRTSLQFDALPYMQSRPTYQTPVHNFVPAVVPQLSQKPRPFSSLKVIGQVDSTFLILEGPGSMIVVDQHAAHERVMFEKIQKQVLDNAVETQPLLFPVRIELDRDDMSTFWDSGVELARYGFEIDALGESTVVVKSVPKDLRIEDIQEVVIDAIRQMQGGKSAQVLEDRQQHMCAQLACHGSVRAGQVLRTDEIRALLEELDSIDYAAHCPHGRPVAKPISFAEIAKWFSRT